jgi:hypothetical protein
MNSVEFTFTFHPARRARFRDGTLVSEWRKQYADLFDEKDEELARNQPNKHFYEWLCAVLFREAMGYTALVEKYIAKVHPRKRDVFYSKVPADIASFAERNQAGLPDLFVYGPKLDDWFFCEVKGGVDRTRPHQTALHAVLSEKSARPVRTIHLMEFRS